MPLAQTLWDWKGTVAAASLATGGVAYSLYITKASESANKRHDRVGQAFKDTANVAFEGFSGYKLVSTSK